MYFLYWQILQKNLEQIQLKNNNKKNIENINNQENKSNLENKNNNQIKDLEKPSFQNLLLVLLMKNSYNLALFMLFWISFYAINLIHLVFVIFFLIYLHNKAKLINIKFENRVFQVNFAHRYWILLIIYTSVYIMAKFLYFLITKNKMNNQDLKNILQVVGLNHNYDINISIGFYREDYASLTIIWVAFLIFSLQQDTYRSRIYLQYQNSVNYHFSQLYLVKKYIANFYIYMQKAYILVQDFMFWFSQFIITLVLILDDFNFFNCFMLFFVLTLLYNQVREFKNRMEFNYKIYFQIWSIFNLCIIGYIILFYLYLFTDITYIKNNVINKNNQIYLNFDSNRDIYGFLRQSNDTNLRLLFLPIIVVFFFSNYMRNFYQIIYHAILDQKKLQKTRSIYQQNINQLKLNQKNELIQLNGLDQQNMNQQLIQLTKFFLKIQLYIQSILVFIFAVTFRLSISMSVYLFLYLFYYYKFYNMLLDLIEKKQINQELEKYFENFLHFYTYKQKGLIWNKEQEHQEDEATQNLQKIMKEFNQMRKSESNKLSNKILYISFILSLVCIFITYSSQICATQTAQKEFNFLANQAQWYLFILGVSCTELSYYITFRSIYFYILIFWIDIVVILAQNMLKYSKSQVDNEKRKEALQQIKKNKNIN
ncbi:hypothetical protein IMG5_167780, partial [Ichthyophthirius multifiliis]